MGVIPKVDLDQRNPWRVFALTYGENVIYRNRFAVGNRIAVDMIPALIGVGQMGIDFYICFRFVAYLIVSCVDMISSRSDGYKQDES